jgi:hypothetical protein
MSLQGKRGVTILIVRGFVEIPEEGNGEKEDSSWFQNSPNFLHDNFGIRAMFKDFCRDRAINTLILQGNRFTIYSEEILAYK